MADLERTIELLEKKNKLTKEDFENLRNLIRLEKERSALGMRGSQHHQKEIDAIKKKLNITEDLYDYEYTQKKKINALNKAEIAAGKTGKEKKKYIKQYEKMEYRSFFKLNQKKRQALRAEILEKQIGIKRIHEYEKLALKKEQRERNKYENKYKIEAKAEVASKGLFRAAGQISGDIDRAMETVFKPFSNKSINPLKWLKQGSDVGKELEDSSVNFKEWGIALKKATANRKMRAGKEIKARERAEEDANKAADRAAEKISKGKPKFKAMGKGKAEEVKEKPKFKAMGKGKAEEVKEKPKSKARGKVKAEEVKEKPKFKVRGKVKAEEVKEKPKSKARGKVKAEETKEKPKSKARGKVKAEDILGTGRAQLIDGPKKQSFLSKLIGGGIPAEDTKKTTKKVTGGSTSKAAGGAGIKHLGSFMAATKGLNMLVVVVEKLALALGLLSKLNFVFALISAVAGVISKISDLDDYIKKLNKTFATMAGPLVGLDSIGNEMNTFNDALFDVRRNMKLGLKGEDISKMFGSVASEGMAPQALATKAGSYDSAITGIRKSSIMLGVSFEDMGKMVTEQMRDLRSSFDDTRDALQEVGYNAAKAGINTNKFYAAIENSASALSFMGNYMGVASANLTKFINEGTLGFKDASQAAASYMQVFQKMDWKSLQKVFAVTGSMGPEARKTHPMLKMMERTKESIIGTKEKGPYGKALKERAVLEAKFKETESKGGDTSEISKQLGVLNKEIRGYENRLEGFDEAASNFLAKGDVAGLSQFKEFLAPNVAQIMNLINDNNNLSSDQRAAQIEVLKKTLDINEDFIKQMDLLTNSIKISSRDLANSLSGDNVELISNTKGSLKAMQDIVTLSGQPGADIEQMRKLFMSLGEKIYGDSDKAGKLATDMIENIGAGRSDDIQAVLAKMQEQLNKGNLAAASAVAKQLDISGNNEAVAKIVDTQLEQNRDNAKKSGMSNEKLWQEYIKKTVSLKDRNEILKESINYSLAKVAEKPADLLNMMVANIASNVSLLASDKRKKQEDAGKSFKEKRLGAVDKQAEIQAEIFKEYYGKGYFQDEKGKFKKKDKEGKTVDLSKEEENEAKNLRRAISNFETSMRVSLGAFKGEAEKTEIIEAAKKAAMVRVDAKAAEAAAAKTEKVSNKTLEEAATQTSQIADVIKDMPAKQAPTTQTPPPPTQKQPEVKKNNDYKTDRKGLTLLDKGDYAINPSTGVGKPKGAFAQEIISKMFGLDESSGANILKGGAAPSSISISLGGLHVNGDVSDPKVVQDAGKKITEMIEQAIRKHEREKQYA